MFWHYRRMFRPFRPVWPFGPFPLFRPRFFPLHYGCGCLSLLVPLAILAAILIAPLR